MVRRMLQREVEGVSCETRRWRIGFLAHDCVLRDDGNLHKPRCYRYDVTRPEVSRPTVEMWQEAEYAAPQLGSRVTGAFSMLRVQLAELLRWCQLSVSA